MTARTGDCAPSPRLKFNQIGAAPRAVRGFFSPIETAAQVDLQLNAARPGPAEAHSAEGHEPTS